VPRGRRPGITMPEIDRARLQQSLIELTKSLPDVQVQNRLMACTDRDLALAFSGMASDELDAVLNRVAPGKANRVREEIRIQKGRHVESRYSVSALKTIIRSLESNRTVAGQRSYFRPRTRNRDR